MTDGIKWHEAVEELVEKNPFGKVFLELSIHDGQIVGATIQGYTRSKKYNSDNAEPVTDILTRVKRVADNKESGSLTFTVIAKNGKITRVVDSEVAEGRFNV